MNADRGSWGKQKSSFDKLDWSYNCIMLKWPKPWVAF